MPKLLSQPFVCGFFVFIVILFSFAIFRSYQQFNLENIETKEIV